MIHKALKIGRWTVDFLFAIDKYDIDGVMYCLYDIGAGDNVMSKAESIMESGKLNRGFTYANPDLRKALVVVGPTSSGRQFLNTFTHEVRHLADAIAKSIGYDLDAEGPAYLTGDAAMALAEVVCELGCMHCRA